MPEEFMADTSVPAHWRLLGILNGFFINDGHFWGSNEWLMEKLNCKSERTIQEAVKTLEEIGKIYCIRTGNTRKIYNTSPRNQLRGTPQPTYTPPRNQLRPISVSNSDSINTASLRSRTSSFQEKKNYNESGFSDQGDDSIQIDPDFVEDAPTESDLKKSYAEMVSWLENQTGVKILNKIKQFAALKKARVNKINRQRLKDRFQELYAQDFYKNNGVDWTTVVNSFDKRA